MELSLQSDEIKELAAALVKAQSVMTGATKDSSNPFFNSKYADLGSVWEAIREPLTKNGLCVTQTTTIFGSDIALVTTLMHSSGQFVRGFFPVRPMKPDPQAIGSAVSYSRRYALAAICGIYQTDDDGNAASGKLDSRPPPTKVETKRVSIAPPQVFKDDVPPFDLPPPESENPAPVSSAIDGIIPFGRDKGKKFSEVSMADHTKSLEYWSKTLSEKGEQPKGKLADYLKELEMWISS